MAQLYREVIEDLCEDCKGKVCLFKDVLSRYPLPDKYSEQYKSLKKFKTDEVSQERREIIEDISSDDCKGKYCLLKEIILRGPLGHRRLNQLNCIEKFGQEEKKNMQEAALLWIDKYAGKFAEVYEKGMSNGDLYNKVMGR